MQMFKETSRPDQLPPACLERRVYEEAPLANQFADGRAMVGQGRDEFVFIIGSVSGFDRRRQGAGKIGGCPCLRSGVDSSSIEAVEGRSVLSVGAEPTDE